MINDKKRDLISQIQKEFPKLSKGQKLIAQFIIDNYDKAAFMTASKLASKVGVSESTVVRFANALGFEGYPQLQKGLEEIIKTKLTTVQRVEMVSEYSDEAAILKKVLKADVDNIRNTLEKIDYSIFHQIVEEVCACRRIYIVALRSSTALADYLGFYLNLILDNVTIVSRGVSNMYEQMLRVSEQDLVIGIGFPRYSAQTLDVLTYAKEQGATVVALTDSLLSPLASISHYPLIAKSNMASFVDSLVAPLSLINALVVSVALREKDEATHYLKKLEGIWEKYNIYENKDQN